ncbi:MAG: putative carboxypeptidase [Chthonomonadaceae bacterium]|nr:putative carboxypeptidase [Chthonomonadaceae bacterium]
MNGLLLAWVMLIAQSRGAVSPDWQTTYERSGYVQTGRYAEAVDYCRKLASASPYAHLLHWGVSPEGRPLIALVMSKDRAFTPEAARKSPKPLVIINNGIHSGEIEGKDAGLMLARNILVTKTEASLLDHVNLLFIPIFSVDAHERFGPYNRINQNGPAEMGWRSTSTNLNLNRDWMKADAEEMKAMLRLLHTWKPDFFFDNHTTDGADWQYASQLAVPTAQTQGAAQSLWSEQMLAVVLPHVEQDGFLTAPYFDFVDYNRLDRGLSVSDFGPRYSTGYLATLNRPSMLVETHMLKPYKVRVEATYSLNKRVIAYMGETADALKAANRAADAAETRMKPGDKVVLSVRTTDATRPFTFRGLEFTPFQSDVSGATTPAWSRKPQDTPTTLQDQYAPTLTLPAPAAYAIPPQWKEIIALLDLHGLKSFRLKQPLVSAFDTYRFDAVTWPRAPFESRFQPRFTAVKIREERMLPAGTVVVPTNQVGAKLLMQLLEPEAQDSLVHWGLFNTIFEQKEYFEDYAMEPIARKMLAENPALKAEFAERLKDPQFAASLRARLEFFYLHSPYADAHLNKYPIVLLTTEQRDAAEHHK